MKSQFVFLRFFAFALCLAVSLSGSAAYAQPEGMKPYALSPSCSTLTSSPIFQVVNPKTQANLLTASQNEASDAARLHGFTVNKGTPFYASLNASAARANGLVGAHRMFNPQTNDFFWTISPGEVASAVQKYGYVDLGIKFYVSATATSCAQPVYRFLLGNKHRFAITQEDRNALTASGWTNEGIKFYGGVVANTDTETETDTETDTDTGASDAMPMGDLEGWRQVFTEDFTTPAPLGRFTATYGNRWEAYSGFNDTSRRGTYSPEKVLSVSNGVLDWHLHTENGTHYVGAVIPKIPGSSTGGQAYGKYTFRFRADTIPGYKMVVILWPDTGGEAAGAIDGEIDFPEADLVAGKEGEMYAFLHAPGGLPHQALPTGVTAADTGWHIASIEWLPGSLTYYLDGKLVGTQTSGVPSKSFVLVFQMETNIGGPAPSPSSSGHIQLDWVSIYAPK